MSHGDKSNVSSQIRIQSVLGHFKQPPIEESNLEKNQTGTVRIIPDPVLAFYGKKINVIDLCRHKNVFAYLTNYNICESSNQDRFAMK